MFVDELSAIRDFHHHRQYGWQKREEMPCPQYGAIKNFSAEVAIARRLLPKDPISRRSALHAMKGAFKEVIKEHYQVARAEKDYKRMSQLEAHEDGFHFMVDSELKILDRVDASATFSYERSKEVSELKPAQLKKLKAHFDRILHSTPNEKTKKKR